MSRLKYNIMQIDVDDCVYFMDGDTRERFFRCVFRDSLNIKFKEKNKVNDLHSRSSTNKSCFLIFPGKFHKENEVLHEKR